MKNNNLADYSKVTHDQNGISQLSAIYFFPKSFCKQTKHHLLHIKACMQFLSTFHMLLLTSVVNAYIELTMNVNFRGSSSIKSFFTISIWYVPAKEQNLDEKKAEIISQI